MDKEIKNSDVPHKKALSVKVRMGFLHLQSMLSVRPRGFCLVTGCPRSGTTAIFNYLSDQNQIATFYESRILFSAHKFYHEVKRFESLNIDSHLLRNMIRNITFKYYAQHKLIWRKQLVDKEPLEPIALPNGDYEEFLDNIRGIFPAIGLLFIVRDPIETIWSMRQRKWGESLTKKAAGTYSLEECIAIWQANVKLANSYASKPNVYVCKFNRLISDPVEESHRIFDFLSIKGNKVFLPRPTKVPAFTEAERSLILDKTVSQRKLLKNL